VKAAYIDTSCLVAVAFDEPGASALADQLRDFDQLFASNLLEAEFTATLVREGVIEDGLEMLSWITWVYPNRPLTSEFERITAHGYLRGADLWHLACALFVSHHPQQISFLTLDNRQAEIAVRLGFIGL
jgi:predicted nucleic acid-binding protein